MAISFVRNALWNVLGFSVSLASSIFLSPYVINKLGPDGYGVWVLAFSLVDYLWLSDMGFRSAVLKYSAHYQARREVDKINEVLNTALGLFVPIAAAIMVAVVPLAAFVPHYFRIPPAYASSFPVLLLAIGWSWAFGLIINVFRAALEGFQQYGVLSRVTLLMTGLRVAGVFTLLHAGYGLREMGYAVVVSQSVGYLFTFLGFRRVFPEFRLSWKLISRPMFQQMAGYGVHTLVATVGTQLLQQGPPVVIGRLVSAAAVGFYSWPMRQLTTLMDVVPQVGMITGARSAELNARDDMAGVARLGVYANRYCFLLFLFPLLMLGLYAQPLFLLWVGPRFGPQFAAESAPLVAVMAAASAFAIAGQQNSSAILYGLGAHRLFARGLVVEAVAGILLMIWALPIYGLFGVAVISALLMTLNRGLFTPWLICQRLSLSFVGYMTGIYARPLLVAIPVLGLSFVVGQAGVDGSNWSELIALGLLLTPVYYGLAFFFAVLPEHRQGIKVWADTRLAQAGLR